MSSEWGPWIDHDGKGCPCVGYITEVVFFSLGNHIGMAGSCGGHSWLWVMVYGFPTCRIFSDPIIRYRIRKPLGLSICESILADLPVEKEPA